MSKKRDAWWIQTFHVSVLTDVFSCFSSHLVTSSKSRGWFPKYSQLTVLPCVFKACLSFHSWTLICVLWLLPKEKRCIYIIKSVVVVVMLELKNTPLYEIQPWDLKRDFLVNLYISLEKCYTSWSASSSLSHENAHMSSSYVFLHCYIENTYFRFLVCTNRT